MTFVISEKPTAYMGLQGMSCSCVYISWSVHSNLLEPKAAVSRAWKGEILPCPHEGYSGSSFFYGLISLMQRDPGPAQIR